MGVIVLALMHHSGGYVSFWTRHRLTVIDWTPDTAKLNCKTQTQTV